MNNMQMSPIKLPPITIIGGGFAGVEAAFYLANNGFPVTLFEMKPKKYSPAHSSTYLAELVCSNSFKSESPQSAPGMLKDEMRRLGSLVLAVADKTKVPAGGALAVNRELFSAEITRIIHNHKNITVVTEEVTSFPQKNAIICTGPLTSDAFAQEIVEKCGASLSFYDAAAPIVTASSIDMTKAFIADRYDKKSKNMAEDTLQYAALNGNISQNSTFEADSNICNLPADAPLTAAVPADYEGDYINCPLDKEEYFTFYNALVSAERAELHGVDASEKINVFEGCMPVEILAKRGIDSVRYGCMKPVGLFDKATGKRPYAVLQLRKEDTEGTLYNLVGFQTNLKFAEQKRVFGLIPALKNAEFARYGVMHRNTFLNAPALLDDNFCLKGSDNVYFGGQITGVEGYISSAMSGLVAAISLSRKIQMLPHLTFPRETMIGALCNYITMPNANFQPMAPNMGILPPLSEPVRSKDERYKQLVSRGKNSWNCCC